MEVLRGLKVGGKTGEEIGAKSRGIIGIRKGMVEMATELVGIGGEAWWARGIDEGATCLGQNRHQFIDFRSFSVVVWWSIVGGGGGFGKFLGREWGDKRRGPFA